uniref:Ig-like domain-containing protein n=1 Tax=Amphiprion percula TaxID=161767 RepID=A0A3P8SBW8_AMPPE
MDISTETSSDCQSFCCGHQVTIKKLSVRSNFKISHVTVTFYCLCTGFIDGSDVTQTSILWKKQGEDATIDCSHTKSALYFYMYWYRQLPGETMKLIVFTTKGINNHDFGDFNGRKHSNLSISTVSVNDSAVYFCAASRHSAADDTHVNTKTLLCRLTVLHTITHCVVRLRQTI